MNGRDFQFIALSDSHMSCLRIHAAKSDSSVGSPGRQFIAILNITPRAKMLGVGGNKVTDTREGNDFFYRRGHIPSQFTQHSYR